MRFRFTLSHAILGSLEVSEFDGWTNAILKLERHEEFHSLVEYFDGSFILYGNNGIVNGGIDFVKEVELNYGLDATILIDIDLTFDEISFSNVFNGQFKLSDLEEMPNNKLRIPIIRDDFWSKFISRLDTPVDVKAYLDLDDEFITPIEQIQLQLPSQKIRYVGEYEWGDSYTYYTEDDFNGNFMRGMQLDFEISIIDDLKKFTIPRARISLDKSATVGIGPDDVGGVIVSDSLFGNFEAPYNGDYTFDIQFYTSVYSGGSWFGSVSSVVGTFFYVFKTTETHQTILNQFTRAQIVCGSDSVVRHNFNGTIRLSRGEQVSFWGRSPNNVTIFGSDRIVWHTVDLASTTSLVLSGEQNVDGVLTSASTVLVKNQSDPSENGVWITGAGAWTRATYADIVLELNNIAVYINTGDTNINTAWKQNNELTSLLDAQSWIYIIASDERFKEFPCDFDVESYLRITADTTSPQTESEGILIHDVGAAICDRTIGEPNTFYSDLFGSWLTRARQYDQDGCAWAYGLFKGLQIRQYTLEEKPFFMSFNQWWRGVNPIFNLSLAYETVQIPSYIVSSPEINLVEDLASWENATGTYPGSWDFAMFSRPFTSVNGSNSEGYAAGTMATVAGSPYTFDVIINVDPEAFETPEVVIIWGILDAAFNEIITKSFAYSGAGDKAETFTLIPELDGTFFGVRVINNTPTNTKNFDVTYVSGVTPTVVFDEETVIRVEEKTHQYDDSNGTSVDFSNVRNITRKYDNERIFNKVEIGYTRWESEDISGIDDPQTKKIYSTRFQKVGKGIQLYSEFIAASLAIETTRRKTREKSSDYKFDNETFIIAINPIEQADESPDTSPDYLDFIPELNENFSSVTGLLNSETRYNIKLSVARNFLRWQNFLQGALQPYIGSEFKFASGEGNYDMTSTMDVNDCLNEDYDGASLDEKGNIPVGIDFIHLPHLYEAEIPMEWSDYVLIRDNRRKPIGISLSDTDHVPMFIKTLEFKPVKGEATILMWAKEYLDLAVFPDTTPMQECQVPSDDCLDALTDELGNILTDELGVCITE